MRIIPEHGMQLHGEGDLCALAVSCDGIGPTVHDEARGRSLKIIVLSPAPVSLSFRESEVIPRGRNYAGGEGAAAGRWRRPVDGRGAEATRAVEEAVCISYTLSPQRMGASLRRSLWTACYAVGF